MLVASPFPPAADATHGGGRATAQLITALAARGHDVGLVCIRREGADASSRRLPTRHREDVDASTHPTNVRAASVRARVLAGLLRRRPLLVQAASAADFAERLRAMVVSWSPEIVQFEMHEMVQYATALENLVRRPAVVVVDHDPGWLAARDLRRAATGRRKPLYTLDEAAWRLFARRAARHVDAYVAFTERDAGAVATLVGRPVAHIPLGIEIPAEPLDPRGRRETVLFVGDYAHPPNADAAVRLAGAIFPQVRHVRQAAELVLVGSRPTGAMQAAAGGGVRVTGRVASTTPYLDEAAIVAAPLRLGGGMRVKVLETLAAGKALVASPRALEGLDVKDGQHVVVAETDAEFASAIVALLADAERRAALGSAARAWAIANISWDRVAERYEALYTTLAGRSRTRVAIDPHPGDD